MDANKLEKKWPKEELLGVAKASHWDNRGGERARGVLPPYAGTPPKKAHLCRFQMEHETGATLASQPRLTYSGPAFYRGCALRIKTIFKNCHHVNNS